MGERFDSLGYSPSNLKFDGRLRKIRVQLSEDHYRLAYRHSYVADENVSAERADQAPLERLQAALRRGVPLAQEFLIQEGILHVQQLIEIPAGTAWLRIAVRDVIGDRLGSLEIPLPLTPEKANATHP